MKKFAIHASKVSKNKLSIMTKFTHLIVLKYAVMEKDSNWIAMMEITKIKMDVTRCAK